jgi:mannosyl-3-phosphoglycerate phosphatase
MRVAVVLTDLDGTLLEPDGTLRPETKAAVASLLRQGVAICPVTSKTPAELGVIMATLEIDGPAGFENGAGIRHTDGAVELSKAAVPVRELRRALGLLRQATGAPVRTLDELDDEELAALTRLSGAALARVRERHATLPLLVDRRHDARLREALPTVSRLRLVRGNRFLHLQGDHDKADVVPRLLSLLAATGQTVACGDAPNDIGLLEAASVRIIVPGRRGPHPVLTRQFPAAIVAPYPHGRGWAAALQSLTRGDRSLSSGMGRRAHESEPPAPGPGQRGTASHE